MKAALIDRRDLGSGLHSLSLLRKLQECKPDPTASPYRLIRGTPLEARIAAV
jgi:hypothetical protein